VRAAWEGIDPARVWDSHAHLLGTGDSGSGVYVNPRMESLLDPAQYARRLFFLNAGCVHDVGGSVDRAYVERMRNLVDGMRPGVRLVLFAFDRVHDERGAPDLARTTFYVPDAYARETAQRHPEYFRWAASVHPYRADAVDALHEAKAGGAVAVKWLPSSMNIDPASPKCERFFRELARLELPLISHAGEERAAIGSGMHDLGNPLRLRRALDAGARVVIAHCASIGEDLDLDPGSDGLRAASFALFRRVFEQYPRNCYADISAMTQTNRAGPVLAEVIERGEWHARLLNGSDYPLPGVMPVYSVDYLITLGLLDKESGPILSEIRQHNPLLFDFVLKRRLRSNGKAFAASIFETRAFFESSDRKTDRKRM
jgi:mannonate dehydratase